MNKLSKYKDYSVLNTDDYDKRRFKKIMNMSKGLQKINKKAELPTFQPLLNDIWAGLYKNDPRIKEEVNSDAEMNQLFMHQIMDDEAFERYRHFTKKDDLTSAIGTKKFGEKTLEWVEEQKKHNKEMEKLIDQIEEYDEKTHDDQTKQKKEEAMNDLVEQIKNSLEEDGTAFEDAMSDAMEETQDATEHVEKLLGGVGNERDERKKVPLRDQIQLAEYLSSNQKLNDIADWAGRMKAIAHMKQKSKDENSIEPSGVTTGSDIGSLLPSELGMYTNPATKADFMRRFAEGETLQYDRKGKEELGKGPVILCLDQSGSMNDLDNESKGFTLALMSIAKKQRRDFGLILFSDRAEVYKYEKGKIKINDMVGLAKTFLNGGTNFMKPLQEALNMINETRFKKADIVFVTDGASDMPDDFLWEFNKTKQKKDFKVLSMVIGGEFSTISQFSDKVVTINDFEDENSHTAFEI